MTRPTETGQSSTSKPILDIRTWRCGKSDGYTRKLRKGMIDVNALHPEPAGSTFPSECELNRSARTPSVRGSGMWRNWLTSSDAADAQTAEVKPEVSGEIG